MSSPIAPDNANLTVERLRRVVSATRELNSTLDLSELARIILRIVREQTGIERGTVFVMSKDRTHLTSLVAQEVDEEIQVRVGSGIAGTVAETGKVIDIPDAYRDDRFDPSFDAKLGFRTHDIYCMPVRDDTGALVGVLQLLNRSRPLTRDDEYFLSDISVHVGLAIENARRHLRIMEEKRIEQKLELAREIMLVMSVRKQRLVQSVLSFRCPVCLGGKAFDGPFGLRSRCADCGYALSRRCGVSGSAAVSWLVTLALALGISFALPGFVDPRTEPGLFAVVLAAAVLVLIWLHRTWRMAWMAIHLHSNPPTDDDFEAGRGAAAGAES